VPKDESIIEEDLPVRSSSGSANPKLRSGRRASAGKPFGSGRRAPLKEESDSIAEELIEEDSIVRESKEDSIKEESIANEVDSHRSEKKKTTSESIAEDSIVRAEYDDDNFASYNASQSLQARNRIRFGLHTAAAKSDTQPSLLEKKQAKELVELADEQAGKTLERNRVIGDLMQEMKEYERATLGETLVNRLEKIVASSMA